MWLIVLKLYQFAPTINLYHCCASKNKLDALPISQYGSIQSWFSWCLIPIGIIQLSYNLNTQSAVLNKKVYFSKQFMGNYNDSPNKTCWIRVLKARFYWIPVNAVIVAVVSVSAFSHNSRPPPDKKRQQLHKFLCKAIVRTWAIIQFCQNCVTCPSIRADPRIPPPSYSASPRTVSEWWDLISLLTQYGTVWQRNPYLIPHVKRMCNIETIITTL